uniref:Zinc transport system substrate-binding protein n=1 Tax=Acetithermum autotrophicum TaxID=1446466 RepID=H5SSH3_ACEAU|nr:zinc transport system substrate-binding protein [Candidatus Acetothermum autotrophicum]
MKKVAVVIALLAALVAFGGAAQPKLKVVASFYIPYEFTKNVGGDRVEVKNLVPAGAEPHDFEPSPADIRAIEEAQVFVYNGASMESWVERVLSVVRNRDKLVVIEATKGLPLRKAEGEELEFDPHVWTDPILAKEMVKNIRDGLIVADGAGSSVYTENAKSYSAKLDALDTQIRAGLRACRLREFIISHRFMDYFAARYGLTAHALSGLEPSEPTPQRLAELIRLGREKSIKYIFAERADALKALEVLARELGAQILTLNTGHSVSEEDERAGKNYLVLMEENLKNLRIGLECS